MKEWFAARIARLNVWIHDLGWVRRKLYLILFVLGAGWVLTGILIWFIWSFSPPKDLLIGILAAWCGELLFFSLIGFLVAITPLEDPRRGYLDQRIRIMFGRWDVPDVIMSYVKSNMSKQACYVSEAQRTIQLEKFSPVHDAYLGRIKTEYRYRNLLNDVDYDEQLPFAIHPDKFEQNAPGELGRVVSIIAGGKETVARPLPIEAGGFRTRPCTPSGLWNNFPCQ
jgi:hypothetical protein